MKQPALIKKTQAIFQEHPEWTDFFFLLLLALVCFWPFSLNVFSAKNDNIIAVLPYRFNISEAIRAGHLPLWSPYIYLGFPLHGDMQSGCWNPVVWIISLFTIYNLTALHFETLLYIFLSGVGMYKLLQGFKTSRSGSFLGASAYMLSGFITDTGGSNLIFLASAAFIPFVLCYYCRLLTSQTVKNSIKAAIALFFLLTAGYPAFFILTAYVMFAGFLFSLFLNIKREGINSPYVQRLAGYHFLVLIILCGLAAPAIVSYTGLLPFYERGAGVDLRRALQNSMHPVCSLSVLLPPAAVKNPLSFTTDLISRNFYFNSYFLIFFIASFWTKKTSLYYFIIIGIIFFLFFSFGAHTPIREWTYHTLPLMNTFRHPSNGRLWIIIGCLVISSKAYTEFESSRLTVNLKFLASAIIVFVLMLLIYALLQMPSIGIDDSFLKPNHTFRTQIKLLLDHISFYDVILITSILQLSFLGFFLYYLKRRFDKRFFVCLFVFNSFFLAQLSMPFTFASRYQPKEINTILQKMEKGYPFPDLTSTLQQNSAGALQQYAKIGISNFYNKKIGLAYSLVSPTLITSFKQFRKDSTANKVWLSYPPAYLGDSLWSQDKSNGQLHIISFSNNKFEFLSNTTSKSFLCLQQFFLPGWEGEIDGQKVPILKTKVKFMSIAVPPGRHRVKFSYQPAGVQPAVIISLTTAISILLLLAWKKNKTEAV